MIDLIAVEGGRKSGSMKDGKVPRFFNVFNVKNSEEGGSDSKYLY